MSDVAPAGDPRMLDELRALAEADAVAVEELAAVIDALAARVADFERDIDVEGFGALDRDALWNRVAQHLDGSDPSGGA